MFARIDIDIDIDGGVEFSASAVLMMPPRPMPRQQCPADPSRGWARGVVEPVRTAPAKSVESAEVSAMPEPVEAWV